MAYFIISKLNTATFIYLTPPIAIGYKGAPDKPCGVGRADANPKLLLNDT